VEKTAIEEDWRQSGDRLVLTEARIKGSGAGYDPPEGSVLRDGWWHYRPQRETAAVTLARAAAPGEWRICVAGGCHTADHYLGGSGDSPATIALCPAGR
jgi:hypothetical protein